MGFIKWLYGPAGAGKSAIAQSIAEMCHARRLLLASFFFSRTDPKRNNESCLIASIAYQIALNAPVTRDAIEAAVDKDPAIFQCSIEAQLMTLIINPLSQLAQSGTFQSNPIPNLIIIDGLDECNDHRVQQHILYTISSAVQQPDVPLKFLICSRAEPQLTLEFKPLTSEGRATGLSLEDGYEQNADIERYLMDSFHKIATTHPLKAYIPSTWPTKDVISTLVRKSSGQFIFAATVIKYISFNRDRPTRRLEIILGMKPSRNDRPFAELDSLYKGILSFVKDVKATLQLLGVLILSNRHPRTPKLLGKFMLLDPAEVECLLLDLASVVECLDMDTPIRMLHASFPDFLFDRSRSGEYYIDASMIHAEIARLWLSYIQVHESEGCVTCLGRFYCNTLDYALRFIIQHLSQAEPSANLREALLNTRYITALIKLEHVDAFKFEQEIPTLLAGFLFFLKDSKFTDTEDLYLHHRNIYDRIMCKRIADFPLDLGFIVGLGFVGSHPSIGVLDFYNFFLGRYIPAVKDPDILRLCQTLHFRPPYPLSCSHYVRLLTEFFTDPSRAGEHALDSSNCALVAGLLLDCFIPPCSNHKSHLHYSDILDLLFVTAIVLSKARHSNELVTRINHADINCEISSSRGISFYSEVYRLEESLRTLIKGIGDYLTRVVGSVPIDLKITLRVHDRTTSPEYRTCGPMYYEGQGQTRTDKDRLL